MVAWTPWTPNGGFPREVQYGVEVYHDGTVGPLYKGNVFHQKWDPVRDPNRVSLKNHNRDEEYLTPMMFGAVVPKFPEPFKENT